MLESGWRRGAAAPPTMVGKDGVDREDGGAWHMGRGAADQEDVRAWHMGTQTTGPGPPPTSLLVLAGDEDNDLGWGYRTRQSDRDQPRMRKREGAGKEWHLRNSRSSWWSPSSAELPVRSPPSSLSSPILPLLSFVAAGG